jgi:protein phosphatase
MGTTIVTAFITGDKAMISNVGDSRAYLIRDGEINQITHDHSWKAEQLKMKVLSKKEILDSPFKHTITRSLGFQSDVQVDSFRVELAEGDHILLCSDGLYESIPDPVMLKLIQKHKKTEKICRHMIKTANKRSGHDNITVVIARISKMDTKKKSKFTPTDTVLLPPK